MTCLASNGVGAEVQLQPIRNFGARKGCVVSTTPLPIYPRGRHETHCARCRVGVSASLDGHEKSRPPTGIQSPDGIARGAYAFSVASYYRQFRLLFLVLLCHLVGSFALCQHFRPVKLYELIFRVMRVLDPREQIQEGWVWNDSSSGPYLERMRETTNPCTVAQ